MCMYCLYWFVGSVCTVITQHLIACRAVRAMNETLKQNRLLREQRDDRSFSHSPTARSSGGDLQKNVCLHFGGNHVICYYLNETFLLPISFSSAHISHYFISLIYCSKTLDDLSFQRRRWASLLEECISSLVSFLPFKLLKNGHGW